MSEPRSQSAGDRHSGQLPVFSWNAVTGISIVFFCAITTIFFKGRTKKKRIIFKLSCLLGDVSNSNKPHAT